MSSFYGTPFAETEAILAAQERDDLVLKGILAEMSQGEKRRLEAACDYLSGAINLDLGSI